MLDERVDSWFAPYSAFKMDSCFEDAQYLLKKFDKEKQEHH